MSRKAALSERVELSSDSDSQVRMSEWHVWGLLAGWLGLALAGGGV